jgi:phospholipid/cholesterol/gamma-HCH transport system ATP-binding protein
MSLISLNNIHKSFGSKIVLDGINIEINKGDSLVIVGGSGTGKSVLIKIMIGLINPDIGEVILDNIVLSQMTEEERCKTMLRYGYLFQSGALFDSLNIFENIIFAIKRHSNNLLQSELEELAKFKLNQVGLDMNILNLYPSDLSGGMQKRVALARSICHNPDIIFFDEPTTGLDPIMSNTINNLMYKVKEELRATTITVTHDMNCVRSIANKIIMLDNGKILWSCNSLKDMQDSEIEYVKKFSSYNIF